MSADNWAVCPRCKRDAASPDDFEEREFREDYEQHVTEVGEYFINYHGECQRCGLKHSFKHKQQLVF